MRWSGPCLAHSKFIHFFENKLGIRDHGWQEKEQIRPCGSNFLHQRGRVGERWRKGFIYHQLKPQLLGSRSRIGLTEETEAAVLSVTMATVLGLAPALFAVSRNHR